MLKKRGKKFYPIHWICLIVKMPLQFRLNIKSVIILVINALLFQSWIPVKTVWLSYNSVTWYLSSLLFITYITPQIHKCIKKVKDSVRIYGLCILAIWCVQIVCALVFIKFEDTAVSWILYANPIMRVLDYTVGMLYANMYMLRVERPNEIQNRNLLGIVKEAITVILVIVVLVIYRYVPYSLQRAAIHTLPALLLIAVIAAQKGNISKILSSRTFVYLGCKAFIYF